MYAIKITSIEKFKKLDLTPRIPNFINKTIIVLELLRSEKCHF